MAIKLHTVGASETNLKHYVCVSGQNHLVISTPGLKNNMDVGNSTFAVLLISTIPSCILYVLIAGYDIVKWFCPLTHE
jgi:hypothetical protein